MKAVKIGDFFIASIVMLAGLAVFAAFALAAGRGSPVAGVYMDGELLFSIDLGDVEEPEEYALGGEWDVVIIAEPGRIRFASSGCPDGLCVKSGWLSLPGQSAACLPARVFLRLDANNSDIDVIIK